MLDTVTHLPATKAPRRQWTVDDDFDAMTARALGASDEEVGRRLGRSAKSVHHRRARLAAIAVAKPALAPVGHELARAAADIDAADMTLEAAHLALEDAHARYAEVMAPYVRTVAAALRVAGICGTTGDDDDYAQGGSAWELVEALTRVGVEIRVPA